MAAVNGDDCCMHVTCQLTGGRAKVNPGDAIRSGSGRISAPKAPCGTLLRRKKAPNTYENVGFGSTTYLIAYSC